MDLEKRLELIVRAPTEEVVTLDDLKQLLETKSKITAYDGFEPSGLMHLGTGLLRSIKLQDMIDARVDFLVYLADWFAWINNKLGGDMKLIQTAGEYFIEGWKACGVDTKKIKVAWTSDAVKDPEYWKGVINISKMTTVQRAIRAGTIMGRDEGEMQHVAQLLYPMMQAYDPFYLGADILQLGMDQRKATILTKEVAPKIDGSNRVAVHHHLLLGLQGGVKMNPVEAKMSKSVPKSAIYIHDTKAEIKDKINSAYCPEKTILSNPILEIWKYIIFRKYTGWTIDRPAKFGGKLEIQSYEELEQMFAEGKLHPMDLKGATADALEKLLEPVRKHFEKDKKAKKLYDTVRNAQVTR